MPKVRDHDGASHDEGDVERFHELHLGDASLLSLKDVVGDAVDAPKNNGAHQTQELLRSRRQRPVVVVAVVNH